jgi:hypothetical protein
MGANRDTLGIEFIVTDKDGHFTGALATNAVEHESINFPTDWGIVGIQEMIIESVSIQSDQQLEWDIYVWSGSENANADLDLDTFLDYFNFPTTSGKRLAGANQYYYASVANNVAIPYRDNDKSSKLHVSLVNRSATAKNAGATGEVVVRFVVRPIRGI